MQSVLRICFLGHISAFEYLNNRKGELFRKLVVARVVGGNCHNCACTVRGKHVIGNEYWNFFAVYRIDCVRSRKSSRLFFV